MIGLTFVGGGNRSFYQVGLWERWGAGPLPIARRGYREHAPIDATIEASRRDAMRDDAALDALLTE